MSRTHTLERRTCQRARSSSRRATGPLCVNEPPSPVDSARPDRPLGTARLTLSWYQQARGHHTRADRWVSSRERSDANRNRFSHSSVPYTPRLLSGTLGNLDRVSLQLVQQRRAICFHTERLGPSGPRHLPHASGRRSNPSRTTTRTPGQISSTRSSKRHKALPVDPRTIKGRPARTLPLGTAGRRRTSTVRLSTRATHARRGYTRRRMIRPLEVAPSRYLPRGRHSTSGSDRGKSPPGLPVRPPAIRQSGVGGGSGGSRNHGRTARAVGSTAATTTATMGAGSSSNRSGPFHACTKIRSRNFRGRPSKPPSNPRHLLPSCRPRANFPDLLRTCDTRTRTSNKSPFGLRLISARRTPRRPNSLDGPRSRRSGRGGPLLRAGSPDRAQFRQRRSESRRRDPSRPSRSPRWTRRHSMPDLASSRNGHNLA